MPKGILLPSETANVKLWFDFKKSLDGELNHNDNVVLWENFSDGDANDLEDVSVATAPFYYSNIDDKGGDGVYFDGGSSGANTVQLTTLATSYWDFLHDGSDFTIILAFKVEWTDLVSYTNGRFLWNNVNVSQNFNGIWYTIQTTGARTVFFRITDGAGGSVIELTSDSGVYQFNAVNVIAIRHTAESQKGLQIYSDGTLYGEASTVGLTYSSGNAANNLVLSGRSNASSNMFAGWMFSGAIHNRYLTDFELFGNMNYMIQNYTTRDLIPFGNHKASPRGRKSLRLNYA